MLGVSVVFGSAGVGYGQRPVHGKVPVKPFGQMRLFGADLQGVVVGNFAVSEDVGEPAREKTLPFLRTPIAAHLRMFEPTNDNTGARRQQPQGSAHERLSLFIFRRYLELLIAREGTIRVVNCSNFGRGLANVRSLEFELAGSGGLYADHYPRPFRIDDGLSIELGGSRRILTRFVWRSILFNVR